MSFEGDRDTFTSLVAAIDVVDAALATLQDLATSLERAQVGQVPQAAARVISAAKAAQDVVADAYALIESTADAAAVPSGAIDALVHWWQAQQQTLSDLNDIADQLRTIRAEARKRTRRTMRIYEVRPGDTLESIARETMGDASRANELGIRDDQLYPGLVVPIPEAS